MYIAGIKYCDVADGPGVRVGLYVSGCTHHCPGCHNREAQAFSFGKCFTEEIAQKIIESSKVPYVTGLSLLGGEPMEPENQRALVPFLERWHQEVPGKDIWCWTGCIYEAQLLKPSPWRCEATDDMLRNIDVLVDGPYIEAKRDLTLKFRGSSNQRILKLHPQVKDISWR